MVEQISYEELQILPLTKKHRLTSFNSTSSELNDFLIHNALKDQTQMISRTYLCFWKEKLTGFITLLADTLEVKLVHESERVGDYPYKKYPAIKIGRLAVDKKIERKGIGRFLLLAAIGKTISISNVHLVL